MKSLTLLTLICAFSFSAIADKSHCLAVEDAWVRLTPPGAKNTAAYMTIKNSCEKDISISSIKVDISKHTMLHKTTHKDGMMKMEHMHHIVVPAKGQVELKPGELHLMVMGISNPDTKTEVLGEIKTPDDDNLKFTLKYSRGPSK